MTGRLTSFIFAVCLATMPAGLTAAEPATTSSAVEVREWVVFDVDTTQNVANARKAWPSTLPPFVTSRRAIAGAGEDNRPRPIGVIRFSAPLDAKSPTDVLLSVPGGETQASWPRAQVKTGRLLWTNLMPADGSATPAALEPGQWLAPLRAANTPLFRSDTQAESFLLYDVSLKFPAPLRLTGGPDGVRAANTTAAPLQDVTLYKKRDGRWTRATLARLAPAIAPAPPTTAKADPAAAFDPPTTRPATGPTSQPATAPATTQSATAPATRPADSGTLMPLVDAATDDAQLLAPWRPVLADAGVPAGDVETVLGILAARALDERWLTVVYRLDPAEMDRLMPLEVVPTPQRVVRVGLVIVRGLDPDVDDEIDRLIAQFGDADYAKRQDAMDRLRSIGNPATGKLQRAVNHTDLEIAQRAETLLAELAKQKTE